MRYIVLDLEWNQPVSWQTSAYRKVGDRLIFEMIQIGAVKMSEDRKIEDSISIPIAPTHYTKIHPRIRKMTGLGPEELAGAPAFREALEQFAAWCGEDYIFLTWGCDDVSILHQNIEFFECGDIPLAPVCDIQHLYAEERKLKDRPSLQSAMALAGIDADENRPFHNALNDAWYTALVFATVEDAGAVFKYERKPKNLIHKSRHQERTAGDVFPSVRDALSSPAATDPVCPRCGRNLKMDGEYIQQRPDKYLSVGKCAHHGRILVRLSFLPGDDNTCVMKRSMSSANAGTVAYIHTKQLQNTRKREEWLKEHDTLPDPDEALREAEPSDMPFDRP